VHGRHAPPHADSRAPHGHGPSPPLGVQDLGSHGASASVLGVGALNSDEGEEEEAVVVVVVVVVGATVVVVALLPLAVVAVVAVVVAGAGVATAKSVPVTTVTFAPAGTSLASWP